LHTCAEGALLLGAVIPKIGHTIIKVMSDDI
jgi:hypothetical protein